MSATNKYRLAFVEYYLRKFAAKQNRILDLGCGMGQYRDCTSASYVGLDVTSQDYKAGCPRIVDVVASAIAIPAPAECYDLVFSVGALYQMPNPPKVLSECYRILRPGGRGLFFDYNRRTQERLEAGEGMKRPKWSQWELKRLLEKAGFRSCELLLPIGREIKQPTRTIRLLLQELLGQWVVITGVK